MNPDYFNRENNQIDPTAIIAPRAVIGKGNTIGAYTVINDCVVIGDNNYIAPHVVIGQPAEYRIYPENPQPEKVIIGNRNRLSEFSRIQAGILTNGTIIGNDCYIMAGSHIGHDCKIGNMVTIAPNAVIGGSTELNDFANVGMLAATHPRVKIGKGAMVGLGAAVTKDVPAWETWAGVPARYMKTNYKGIERFKHLDK